MQGANVLVNDWGFKTEIPEMFGPVAWQSWEEGVVYINSLPLEREGPRTSYCGDEGFVPVYDFDYSAKFRVIITLGSNEIPQKVN